jgi:hypothetical protein
LAALVAFLVLADVAGGAATHHPERSLLPVYWFFALLAGGLVTRLAREPRAWLLPTLAIPLAVLGSVFVRPAVESSFVDRREEEQVGSLLRRLGASAVALDTDDFGYFAIQAALGYGKSSALSDHDPRHAAVKTPTTSAELAARLAPMRARWLVIPRERAALAEALGLRRAATPRFTVLELQHPPAY